MDVAHHSYRVKDSNVDNANDDAIKLVPCRWAKSGWKYVQDDPGSTTFFSSPNRVNSFGMSQKSEAFRMLKLRNQQNNSVEDDFRPRDSNF